MFLPAREHRGPGTGRASAAPSMILDRGGPGARPYDLPVTEPILPKRLGRRTFLGGAVTLVCSLPLNSGCEGDAPGAGEPGEAPPPGATRIDGWLVPAGTTLSPARYALLAAAMDALIPGDEEHAGALAAAAPFYLDQLLGAFRVSPPRIFAGGPYSGRHGGLDGFSQFTPLTRIEELRWRLYLEGSLGLPEREFNGPVVGLLQRYEEGLDALDALALASEGAPFTRLELETRRSVLLAGEEPFVQLVYEHAVEGSYGDPVYGGNLGGAGWAAIEFEGDRQPLGYTAEQMRDPDVPG